jgi:hypothetical protein
MSHLRSRRDARLAMTSRGSRRRWLGVERLEQRSMLAADAGDPAAAADGLDDVPAVEIDPPAMVEPRIVVDACFVEDLPAAIDPGVFPGGLDPEVLDPEVLIITDPVVDPLVYPAVDPGFSEEQQTTSDGEESTIVGDATAADGEDSSLPEGWTLTVCPGPYDPPGLVPEEPIIIICPGFGDAGDLIDVTPIPEDGSDGDATTSPGEAVDELAEAADAAGDAESPKDLGSGADDRFDGAKNERIMIAPAEWIFVCDFGPALGRDGDGVVVFAAGMLADAVPVADPLAPVPAVANDDVSELLRASTASGDDLVVAFVAASAAATPASSTVAPADSARLFAAYAIGLGQAGTDAMSAATTGGRRSFRRGN